MLAISLRLCRRNNFATVARSFASERHGVTGIVKWFDPKKGFGFLVPDDGSQEVFVHYSVVHANGFKSLADGEPVEFDIVEMDDGKFKAVNVTGPGGAAVRGASRRVFPTYDSGSNGGGYGGGGGYGRGGYGGGFGDEENREGKYPDDDSEGVGRKL